MHLLSRREFGSLVAGAPLAGLIRSIGAAAPVAIGVTSSSFRSLPRIAGRDNVDDVIGALTAVRATNVELAFANVEPAPPSTAPVMGGSAAYPRRIVFTPEEIAATNAEARASLRAWRLEGSPAFLEDVRGKLAAAGIVPYACALSYDQSFTDDEIDATLRHARTLGVTTVSSPMTMATAERLAKFAERHQVTVAIHNQMDGNPQGAIDTSHLEQALAISPRFRVKLDIGNLTASNRDAVAELRRWQPQVSYVVVRDRLRNGGASQLFGEGDTPIREVLAVLARFEPPVPALVEYDSVGLRAAVDEVKASLAYLREARQAER
jgi:sugar phosphate isomerase/epimerase